MIPCRFAGGRGSLPSKLLIKSTIVFPVLNPPAAATRAWRARPRRAARAGSAWRRYQGRRDGDKLLSLEFFDPLFSFTFSGDTDKLLSVVSLSTRKLVNHWLTGYIPPCSSGFVTRGLNPCSRPAARRSSTLGSPTNCGQKAQGEEGRRQARNASEKARLTALRIDQHPGETNEQRADRRA